jgi:hypothetical protein
VSPVTSGATVLAHLSCDGSAVLVPNDASFGFEISARGVMDVVHWFRSEHRKTYKCRAADRAGAELSDAQYNARSFTIDNLLYHLTTPVATSLTNLGVDFGDMAIGEVDSRLKMPSTCTFDHWQANGQCRLTFTGECFCSSRVDCFVSRLLTMHDHPGFSDPLFFDARTDLNMYLSVCPGSFVPEAYIECIGEGCALFGAPIPCKVKTDCPSSSLQCDTIQEIVNPPPSPPSPPSPVCNIL